MEQENKYGWPADDPNLGGFAWGDFARKLKNGDVSEFNAEVVKPLDDMIKKMRASSNQSIVYYAHPMSDYDRKVERMDVELLQSLQFLVFNPSDQFHRNACLRFHSPMDYFLAVVELYVDAVAFRAFPGGRIGAGVAGEILVAREDGKPVIELPGVLSERFLSKDQTREYLHLLGRPGEG